MNSAIELEFAGQQFLADTRRALFWPAKKTLIVADLHIGKAEDFGSRGTILPPYEMSDIHDRLQILIKDYAPQRLVALGDSFHRAHSFEQLPQDEKGLLDTLLSQGKWIFIEGNHDTGGLNDDRFQSADEFEECGIMFSHRPPKERASDTPFIFGHYHPKFSRGDQRNGRITRPCFIWDKNSLILPAFGTYTGGLDIKQPAIARYFSGAFSVAVADTAPKPAFFSCHAV
ncbi:MAG: ligase-associated DNA damage response endonuclease PdeM [Pseudomonadota bacterium]